MDYKTHPMEVDALDAILQQWNIPYKRDNNDGKSWNINSTNPCKGFVVDDSNDKTVEENSTPGKLEILCLCDQNSSTCNLIKLAAWDLDISGTIPVEIHNLTKLVYLDISSNSISGELPTFLWNLSDMRFMYLASNNFYGLISPEIGNLKNIKTLDISHNSMSGELPTFLWNLSDMRFMDLTSNNFYGSIPPEIGNLKNIKTLWLTNNSFNGLLPSEIGNLRNIQMLELSSNNFNGSLPSDIGNLKSIKGLWLKRNNFGGSLPSEIGNLKNIQKLSVSNNNFGGNIPHSLWNLTNMEGLWLYNNIFSGSLPQEIGNLKNIISLDLSSNKLKGEIPNSLWNLTNLKDLQLQGNSFQGSIPSAIGNLVNLTTLSLSRNKFEGEIPNSVGNLTNLKTLDLSFNNLFGNLPPFIFNIPTLQSMSLSNNKFLGYLPDKKSDNLTMIDLSNNELEGRIPKWSKEVALNLVNNLFSLEECQKMQPRGLECLQITTKCFVGKDLFASFAINCGGEKIRSSDGKTIFEADNIDNNVSYYVADNNQWAVTFGLLQLINSTKDITNTLDPKLYRSSRKSSITLKYYGLGLKTGNYTIDLMFSNVDNGDNDTYAFDIYIQGILRDRNFEILKEKGALNKSYVVPVTENTKNMEISFIPNRAIGTKVLISAIKVYADFEDGIDQKKGSKKKSSMKKSNVTGISVGVSFFILLCFVGYYIWIRNRKYKDEGNIEYLEGTPIHAAANKEFTYLELVTMTSNFNRIIGKGGFGNVYHGIDQRNGSQVAVKVLSDSSIQGSKEFKMEAQILTRIHHKNFVSLVGYCIDSGHLALVYEYMEGGCLKNLISGQCSNSTKISWRDRIRIALEIAQGLNYLHRECQPAIVHRDVKTTNILLTRDYEVKIADFGLSKIFENGANDAMSTIVMGTFGYIDPEYYRMQKLNEKSDVYSFGIVLIELITGQPAIIDQEGERIPVATLVEPKLERGEIDEILDPKLNGEYNTNSAKKALEIAFTCIHPTSSERPLMFDVVKQLKECLEFELPQGSTSVKSIDYNNLDITAPFAR